MRNKDLFQAFQSFSIPKKYQAGLVLKKYRAGLVQKKTGRPEYTAPGGYPGGVYPDFFLAFFYLTFVH